MRIGVHFHTAAFSLVETTVAMSLGAIVLLTTSTALDAITQAPTSISRKAKARQIGELTIRKLTRELGAATLVRRAGVTLIQFTTPKDLEVADTYDILKYEWNAADSALTRGQVTDRVAGNLTGTSYTLLQNCPTFELKYECEVMDGPTVSSRLFTGDPAGLGALAAALIDPDLEVVIRAIHVEIVVREEGMDYTSHSTVYCAERPPLIDYP